MKAVRVICVLAIVYAAEAQQPNLVVEYPQQGNYNLVTLSCRNGLGESLNDTEFLRRAPGQDSRVQLQGSPINGEITISLTQEEEGYFSCSSSGGNRSSETGLAAEPDLYDGTVIQRNITFPTADSSREVNLNCSIRPGALSDSYSVQWESSIPGIPEFTIVDIENYDIRENIDQASRHQYQCKVTIQHRSDNSGKITYIGPVIVLNKIVLASIENDILSVSVLEGERATFACEFRKGNIPDIDVEWTVDSDQHIFDECGSMKEDVASDSNGCYSNDTHSVLVLNALAPGSYPVQCILQQNIPDDFKNDPSYQEIFNSITRSASLTIHPTSVVTSITPSVLPPNDPTSSTTRFIAAGVGATTGIIVIVVLLFIIFCCCIRRRIKRAILKHSDVEMAYYRMPSRHVSQNEQFHAEDIPEYSRKMGFPNGARSHPDHLELIYNVSMNSVHSCFSGLSEDGSLSCPPSPAVSSISDVEESPTDKFLGPILSIDNYEQFDSDKTHSTRHSSKSGKSSQSGRSGHLDLDYKHHYHYSSSTHLAHDAHNCQNHYSDHQSEHHRNHSHSPRSRSPTVSSHYRKEPFPMSGPQYHSHRDLYKPPPAPMRMSRSAELASSFVPQPPQCQSSSEGDGDGKDINDEVLLMAVGCLMHQENCKIPNCPCKQIKERFQHILPQTRQHMTKEANLVVEEMQCGNFDLMEPFPMSGPQYHSHRELYQPPPAPMRMSRSAELASSFVPQPSQGQSSSEGDGDGKDIIDEVLLMAVGCLMHQENCQISNCPCKKVKERFQHILPQHTLKEANLVVEEIRTSDGKQKFKQRHRSKSMDLTHVMEQPESCATPDIARGVLCGPAFSPAVTPAGEAIRVLSPTLSTTTPTVLLHEISLSADNLPSLCLNNSPMAKTPLIQIRNHSLSSVVKKSASPMTKPTPVSQQKGSPCSYEQPKHLHPTTNVSKPVIRCGSTSSHRSHASHLSTSEKYTQYLSEYTSSDSGYTGSGAPSSYVNTSSARSCNLKLPKELVHASRNSQPRAWSPTSCLTDASNYQMMYDMFRSRITPEYVTPTATLSQCTSRGIKYFDKSNGFALEILAGAIPEGVSITIDIGVALYGPFQYPEGLRPVSPVFWVCVRDENHFQFMKPVKVTIPHCLNLKGHKDVESLGLTFLKGDHEMNSQQMYQLQQAEGYTFFNPHKRYGVFQTTHFCYLCISSKISWRAIQKAMFCVYAAIPRTMSPREPAYVYFFVTFLLSTCLETLKKQISKIPELHNHIVKQHDFQFLKHCRDPALGIVIPESSAPGWTVGLQFNKEILLSDIDFFVSGDNSKELLKIKEEEGMYPPRFNLVISCSPTARQSQTRVQFVGAVKEMVFDIPLNPLQTSVTTSFRYDTMPQSPLSLPVFLTHVGSQIPNKWRQFGILLHIPWSELETYPAHSCMDCFARLFDTWEGNRSPEFSWETVIKVLESPLLKERSLAHKVREMMTTVTTDPPDDSIKHKQFKRRGKQFEDEITHEVPLAAHARRGLITNEICYVNSSNGTNDEVTDVEMSLPHSHQPPSDLQLSSPPVPAKQKNFVAKKQCKPVKVVSKPIIRRNEIPHEILHVNSTNGEVIDLEMSLTCSRPPPSDLQLSSPPVPVKQKKSVTKEQPKHFHPTANVSKPFIRRGSTLSSISHISHRSHISHASDGSITTETLC